MRALDTMPCSLASLIARIYRLTADGIDTNMVWNQIVEVVLKTLYCVQDNMPSSPNSFELFGFDVLIDQDLKPW